MMIWFAVALGSLLGGVVQTITGFGAAVVLMTVLPYFFPMTIAPSISTSICLLLSAALMWKFRRAIRARLMLTLTLAFAAANYAAIALLDRIDLKALSVAFGVFLVLLGSYFLLLRKEQRVKATVPIQIAFGLIGGASTGLFSIGGPTTAIYYLSAADNREEYLGNMQATFFINSVLSLAARAGGGYYTAEMLPYTLFGIVCILFGQKLGLRISSRLDAARLRTVVYIYVILSGIIKIAQELAA